MDRPARLRRIAALPLLLALAACAVQPLPLRLEDRAQDNVVRIVNPTGRTVVLYVRNEPGFSRDFQFFDVRYRDAQGRPVPFNGGGPDSWWTPLSYSSQLHLRGREPSRTLTIAAGRSRDFPRAALFGWFDEWSRRDPMGVAGPCTAQLRMTWRLYPRVTDYFEILSEWQPAACPGS